MKIEMSENEYYAHLRNKKKIRLRQIVEHVGCTGALISMYENGKANMDHSKVLRYKEFIDNYK